MPLGLFHYCRHTLCLEKHTIYGQSAYHEIGNHTLLLESLLGGARNRRVLEKTHPSGNIHVLEDGRNRLLLEIRFYLKGPSSKKPVRTLNTELSHDDRIEGLAELVKLYAEQLGLMAKDGAEKAEEKRIEEELEKLFKETDRVSKASFARRSYVGAYAKAVHAAKQLWRNWTK